MAKQILRLFPQPSKQCALKNLYLHRHGWYQAKQTKTVVVANFLTSLDGRIAVGQGANRLPRPPKSLTSEEDFRLFLELHAQADCLITHGGYLRALAENKLGNILQLPTHSKFEDLHTWRKMRGLTENPDVVIASASLDFPMHTSMKEHGQKIYIATGQKANLDKCKMWQRQGYEILFAGKSNFVEGASLIQALTKRNYRHVYLIAGPKMLHTMLKTRKLNKFYVSNSHQLLGGKTFKTLLDGEILSRCRLQLNSLFYDTASENNCGQFFSSYTCSYND